MQQINKERIIYLDVLRIIAIFSVLIIHVAAMDWYRLPVDTLEWQCVNFYDALVRFCVPVMLMISGALFLDDKREIKIKTLWSKNIVRIVTAFLFWSLIYNLISIIAPMRQDVIKSPNIIVHQEFYKRVLEGYFHLWFLYLLLPLYMFTPFIRRITSDNKLLKYFLLLSFVFALLIPTLQAFNINFIAQVVSKLNINTALFTRFSFYFVLGYYLSSRELPQAYTRLIYISGIISTLIIICGTVVISLEKSEPSEILFSYLTPFTACQAAALFIFARRNFINLPLRVSKIIANISELCFGVYLVHDFFNMLISAFKVNIFLIERVPYCSVLIIALIIFLCSLLTSWLLHKVKILNRYIM